MPNSRRVPWWLRGFLAVLVCGAFWGLLIAVLEGFIQGVIVGGLATTAGLAIYALTLRSYTRKRRDSEATLDRPERPETLPDR